MSNESNNVNESPKELLVNRVPYTGLTELVKTFNTDYGNVESYAQITDVTCVFTSDKSDADIELKLSNSIEDEDNKNYILIKLFADFIREIEFDEILEASWLNSEKDTITFWSGRLENIGISFNLK
jgi:hypothetical protein